METMDRLTGVPRLPKLGEETACTSYTSEVLLLPPGMTGFPIGEAEGGEGEGEGEGEGALGVVLMASRVPNLSFGPRYWI